MPSGSELRVTLAGKNWILEGDAYALMRAERSLPMAKRTKGGAVSVPHTPESASELMWFRLRFPFKTGSELQLRTASAKDKLRKIRLAAITGGGGLKPLLALRQGEKARQYQEHAARVFQAGGSLLLADDIGLGKTLSAIMGILCEKRTPAVVVCPANLTFQWQDSIRRFTQLRPHILKKSTPYDLKTSTVCGLCGEEPTPGKLIRDECEFCGASRFQSQYPDVVVTSYHKLDGWAGSLAGWARSIVFDEIQELRHRNSKKYRAATQISHAAEYRLGLSATPIHNYGGEMFNVLDSLFPGRLGRAEDFRATWCIGSEASGKEPRIADPAAFGEYLKREHFMLRRTREEVGRELPELQQIVVPMEVELDAETNRQARDYARVLLSQVSGASKAKFQAAGGLDTLIRKATGIAKAKEVARFVEILLDSGEPVVLFGWHTAVYEIWARELAAYHPAFYTGQQGPSQKDQAKADFVDGRTSLLIVSLRSGAGLDGLQNRCNITVIGELDWAPAVVKQCIGRVHRDGQTRGSLSYVMLNNQGSDPFVAEVLGVKTSQLAGVILDSRRSNVLQQSDANAAIRRMAEAYLANSERA